MVEPLDQDRLYFPATERNRASIGDALSAMLPEQGAVLEVASGSGEHAVTFQRRFPGVLWQASDLHEAIKKKKKKKYHQQCLKHD